MGRVKEMTKEQITDIKRLLKITTDCFNKEKERKRKLIYKKKIKGANHGNGRIRNKASK